MKADKNYEVSCKCGCGAKFMRLDNKYRVKEYSLGHATRTRTYPDGFFDYLKGNSWGFPKGHKSWNKGLEGFMAGDKNGSWRGGVTPENRLARKKFYKKIRNLVLERDNYTCQLCSATNIRLHVDHIQSWIENVDLRFSLDNCRTLCSPCHYKLTFGKPMPKDRIFNDRVWNPIIERKEINS